MRLFVGLLLIIGWMPTAIADTVWYIGVADTSDTEIGPAVQRDAKAMQQLLAPIADRADWSLRRSVLTGNNVSRAAILETIDEIKSDRPEVIIFYYSGHGAGSPGQDPYPTLTIDGPDIRFSEIHARLREAKPRLLIIMSDACNVPDREPASYAVERGPAAALSDDGLVRLLRQSGTFLATAASRGEYAYTGAEPQPSVFTKRLLAVIKAETGTASPDWSRIQTRLSSSIEVSFWGGERTSQTPYVQWQAAR